MGDFVRDYWGGMMTIEKGDIHNLFYKPTSEMTNQELNMLVSLNTDAVFDLTHELSFLRKRNEALRQEIDKRCGIVKEIKGIL